MLGGGAELLVAAAPGDFSLDRSVGTIQFHLLGENCRIEEDFVLSRDLWLSDLGQGSDRGITYRLVELQRRGVVLVVRGVDMPAWFDSGGERQFIFIVRHRLVGNLPCGCRFRCLC